MNESTAPSTLFPAPAEAPPAVMPPPSPESLLSVMFTRGFEVFRRGWGPILVAALCLIFSQVPMQIVSMALNIATMPPPRTPGAPPAAPEFTIVQGAVVLLSFVYGILVVTPITASVVVFVANVSRGRAVDWSLLLSGFRRYGAVLVATLIQMVVGLGVTIGGLAVVGLAAWIANLAAGAVGVYVIAIPLGIVAIGFAVWVSVRLSFAGAVAADPMLSPRSGIDAVKYSWRMSKGNVLELIVGLIAVGVVAMLSVLLLCIGYVLVGMPFAFAAYAASYDELVRREHAGMTV